MKRLILHIFLMLLCCIPMAAQEMTEAEVTEVMKKAVMLDKDGKYQEALECYLKVGENTKKQRTEVERTVYVCSQTMAVMCYERLKQYEEGFWLSGELLKGNINEKERSELQHLFVVNGYQTSRSFIRNRKYAEARDILTTIFPYADDNTRKLILSGIPYIWNLEGRRYYDSLQLDEALFCFEKALDGYHDIADTKEEIDVLYKIASIKYYQEKNREAMDVYQHASDLASSIHYDSKLMAILSEMCKLCDLSVDGEKATVISVRMDSLAALTEDDQVRFEYYNHQGDLSKEQGNYGLAEQWYRKNDPYIIRLGDSYKGADKYIYYLKLCQLYAKAERLDEALEYAILSKEDYQKRNAVTVPDYYMPYMTIADVYRQMKDSIHCFQSIDSLFLSIDRLNEPKEKFALYLSRARAHFTFGQYGQSLADYKKADELLATKYGVNDEVRISLLALMGGVENRLGHYAESEQLYRQYALRKGLLTSGNSTDYIESLWYQANAEAFAGHIAEAGSNYSIAANLLKNKIQRLLPYMTTSERDGYWRQVNQVFQNMAPFALKAGEHQTEFTRSCYDGLVLSKAFLLESDRTAFELVKNNGTTQDQRDFNTIASMQAKINEWEKDFAHNADSILNLTSRIRQLETRLAGRCRSYGDLTEFMGVGYEQIKEKLNDGDLLIDFADFNSESRGRVYAAYLVDNRQDFPLLKELFTESRIDSMEVPYPDMYYTKPFAEAMYRLLWMPFKDHVAEGATVYYVPSQLLFQIALESLLAEDGRPLGEHYHFVRLSSARELVRYNPTLDLDLASAKSAAVLYGGLLYDLESKDWAEEAKKYDVSDLIAYRGGGDIARGDSVFRPLPGSKEEVETIGHILREHKLTVTPYMGKHGTEESFLSMSGMSPQILHLSTHGFYYTPDEAQNYDYLKGYKDAMSLSGLVMSGGNATWLGRKLPEGVLGGILTASNVARLDLGNTKLTVLSACKSGRGKATAEGLYGLQRAFKKAGVKTIIMSLWDVSDTVGAEFLNLFYKYLTDKDNHWNKREAFEKAKADIRNNHTDPYYWACFVMLD